MTYNVTVTSNLIRFRGENAISRWLNEILIYKLNISLCRLLLFRALWWMDSVYMQICYLGFGMRYLFVSSFLF